MMDIESEVQVCAKFYRCGSVSVTIVSHVDLIVSNFIFFLSSCLGFWFYFSHSLHKKTSSWLTHSLGFADIPKRQISKPFGYCRAKEG